MMRKNKLFFILVATLIVGFFAYSPLVSTVFDWYLKGYCRTCLRGEIAYENLRHEKGKWIIDQPSFTSLKELKLGGHRFQAEYAEIDVTISWLNRNLSLDISVIEPTIDIGKNADELKNLFRLPQQEFSLFKVHSRLCVPQGSFVLHDFSEDNSLSASVFFSADLACKEANEGSLTLWFDELFRGDNTKRFEIVLSAPESAAPQISLRADEIECSALLQAAKNIWPAWLTCEIVEGRVRGEATITLPPNTPPYAKGQFIINDLELNHPLYELSGRIPELTIALSHENIAEEAKGVPHTVGRVEVSNQGVLHFFKNGQPYWTIDSLGGGLSFHSADFARFAINGVCHHRGVPRDLSVSGQARFADEDQSSMTIDFLLSGDQSDHDAGVHFALRQLGHQWNFLEAQLSHIGKDEFHFVQNICERIYPPWQQIRVFDGTIDASMLVYLQGLKITEVEISNIAAQRLDVEIDPWDVALNVAEASGTLSLDFSAKDLLQTIDADLKIEKGRLSLAGLDQTKWQFNDFHTDLSVRKGIIQKSLLRGKVAGLKGDVELDGNSSGEIARCNFEGKAKDIAAVLPGCVKKGVEKNFGDEDLKILAAITQHPEGFFVKGKVLIADSNNKSDELDFGFALEKSSKKQWGHWPPDPSISQYCAGADLEAIRLILPGLALPSNLARDYWVKHKLGVAGFVFKDGWFEGSNLPLDKYISPFIFQQNQMCLSGLGDVRGTFDEQGVSVRYDARDVVLENSDFAIEIKSISNAPDHSERRFIASHVFDLQKMRGFGAIPISNGTYLEKNSGLLFTDINTIVSLEDGMAHLSQLEAFCNGVFFAGNIDLDWSMPGEGIFEVDIKSHEMQGKVSQVQHIFSHFNKTLFFLKLPIEGNVAFRKEGGHLHFTFHPGDYTLQTTFEGELSDGVLTCEAGDIQLQELSLNFDYNHEKSALDFSDIQGALLVGSPAHVEEYALAGEHIRFTDYANNEAEFDLWVGDRKRDLIRLAGKTRPRINEGNENTVDFFLDRSLSHFGDVHPSAFQLTLKDWSQIEDFRLELDFQLKTLLHDLQRFSRTGFFFLSRSLLKELNELKSAEGSFKVDLGYDGNKALFTYSAVGSNVAAGNHQFQTFLLNGKKKGSTWTVDQLQFDEISLAADILKEDHIWNVNFLGARFGKSLLLGLEGQYRDDESILDAKVNLLEADLAYLDEWPSMKKIIDKLHPSGQVRATGSIRMEFDKAMPNGIRLDANMKGALRSGRLKGLLFQDFENASLRYVSDKGFSLESVNTTLKSAKDGSTQANLFFKNINCNFVSDEVVVDGVSFIVPAENLGWLAENMQQCFPDMVSQTLVDTIRNLKRQGNVQGSLKLEFFNPHCALSIALDDGVYQFMNRDHDLSNFLLEYDPFELKITSKYRYQQQHLWLISRSFAPALTNGELVISEFPLENYTAQSPSPLTVHWQNDHSSGFTIHKIEGSFCGLNLNLARDPNNPVTKDHLYLTGEVHANMDQAKYLLNDGLSASCSKWEVGKGYSLKGLWTLRKDEKPLLESVAFNGELLGRDFEFGGYQFYNMSAQICYASNSLQARHISISDPCGSVQVNEILLEGHADAPWSVLAPSMTVNGFRPSLLRTRGSPPPRSSKALVIRQLELRDFCGILGDRNSYLGKGRLLFANPPKKNLQHTIFAIPSELLTRLGLDLAVLTPVRGVINYEIKEGKIIFTRFKDIYSKGRLSKFYLPNTGFQSHVDFDGNLNLQVRMKQYNLFFKLAELFTVTVQGTLKKPTYSLQKQSKPERSSLIKNILSGK